MYVTGALVILRLDKLWWKKVASSTPQLGIANSRGVWFVVGSSQIELSASVCSIALLRKSSCVLLVYLGQGKLKIPVGMHKSINTLAYLEEKAQMCTRLQLLDCPTVALAKVRSPGVRPAKVGVRPGKPKDWVWIRPTIQSYWKAFLSLLFFNSKLGGNLTIVQSFEEAGDGEVAAHCAYL